MGNGLVFAYGMEWRVLIGGIYVFIRISKLLVDFGFLVYELYVKVYFWVFRVSVGVYVFLWDVFVFIVVLYSVIFKLIKYVGLMDCLIFLFLFG